MKTKSETREATEHEHHFACEFDEQQCDGNCRVGHKCSVCHKTREEIAAPPSPEGVRTRKRFAYIPIGGRFHSGPLGTVVFVKIDEDRASPETDLSYKANLTLGQEVYPLPEADFSPEGVRGDTYRKKPVVIEAIQWTGGNLETLKSWGAPSTILAATNGQCLIIGTLEDGPTSEAVHVASLNDWIIRGVKGEFYPCKPDVFEITYEPEAKPSPLPNTQELVPQDIAHTLWYRGSRLHFELKNALALHPEIWHTAGLQRRGSTGTSLPLP